MRLMLTALSRIWPVVRHRPLQRRAGWAFLSVPCLAMLIWLAAPTAMAESTVSVRLPVENQQAEAREQALSAAIRQVLVRLSGRDDVVQSPDLSTLLQQPGRFLQRYQYDVEDEQLMLAMQFDAAALRRAMATQGVPSWQEDRPPVLVWLAVEQHGRRVLVGGEDGMEVRALLQTAAAKRGLLVLFPLMDSEDQQRISAADVFGGFSERALVATERYGTTQMVLGRMHREGSGWAVRWDLRRVGGGAWNAAGATQEELMELSAAELAARLAEQYAVLPVSDAAQRHLRIQVSGVESLRDFDRLQRYLHSVGGIAGVQPAELEPDSVTVLLLLQAPPQRILDALDQGRQLSRVPALDDAAGSGEVHTPTFRLMP